MMNNSQKSMLTHLMILAIVVTGIFIYGISLEDEIYHKYIIAGYVLLCMAITTIFCISYVDLK